MSGSGGSGGSGSGGSGGSGSGSGGISPLDDRILVQPIAPDDKIGSIVIPASSQERSCRGRAIEVGPGRVYDSGVRVEPLVKKGDLLVFERHAGTEVKIGGEKYLVLREHEVMLVVDE